MPGVGRNGLLGPLLGENVRGRVVASVEQKKHNRRFCMKRLMAVLLCMLLFVGFKWGSSDEQSAETSNQDAVVSEENTSAAPVAGPIDANAVAAASRMLGTGTPEEKQARMEALKNVGEALRRNRENAAAQ